ncbi:hypothetical protein BJ973_003356 [Actinoplanes tereljensis]|nr:hypothetical protein [Actinoplanes tereljensis]
MTKTFTVSDGTPLGLTAGPRRNGHAVLVARVRSEKGIRWGGRPLAAA